MQEPLALRDSDIRNAKLYASRYHMIYDYRERLQGAAVAEVGVAFGDFSQYMIDHLQPRRFDAFDLFPWTADQEMWGISCGERFAGLSHRGYYEKRFADRIAAGTMNVFEGDSSTCLLASDATYDMVYLDGDHSYEGVKKDVEAAIARLSPSGLLIFNDYTMMDPFISYPYGVVQVVNDLCVNHGWKIIGFAFQPNMFCDIALER